MIHRPSHRWVRLRPKKVPRCFKHLLHPCVDAAVLPALVALGDLAELDQLPLERVGGSYLHLQLVCQPQDLVLQLLSAFL